MSLVYGLFNLNGYFGSVFFEVVENIMATSSVRTEAWDCNRGLKRILFWALTKKCEEETSFNWQCQWIYIYILEKNSRTNVHYKIFFIYTVWIDFSNSYFMST